MNIRKKTVGLLFVFVILILSSCSVCAATKASRAMAVGMQLNLQAKDLFGKVKHAKWSSSNKNVAVVSSKGIVTAKNTGNTVIKAKVKGKTYTCKLNVYENMLVDEPTEDKIVILDDGLTEAFVQSMSFDGEGNFYAKIYFLNKSNAIMILNRVELEVYDKGSDLFVAGCWNYPSPPMLESGKMGYVEIKGSRESVVKRVVDLTKIKDTYSVRLF